jgi:hypothetical protein
MAIRDYILECSARALAGEHDRLRGHFSPRWAWTKVDTMIRRGSLIRGSDDDVQPNDGKLSRSFSQVVVA